jgi:hypothetical protein
MMKATEVSRKLVNLYVNQKNGLIFKYKGIYNGMVELAQSSSLEILQIPFLTFRNEYRFLTLKQVED